MRPGAGFLRDLFPQPYLAHWHMAGGYATSPQLPGVRIPESSFMGTAGLAPSHEELARWTAREADLVRRGGMALMPDAQDAVPRSEPIASTRIAHHAAARELRQSGREAAHARLALVHTGERGGRAVLGGRRALRAGRLRVLCHRD